MENFVLTPENEEEIINFWRKKGIILDNEKNIRNVSLSLEILTQILKKNEKECNYKKKHLLLNVIIYRVFRYKEENMNYEQIRTKVIEILENYNNNFEQLVELLKSSGIEKFIDIEAHACAIFSEKNKF